MSFIGSGTPLLNLKKETFINAMVLENQENENEQFFYLAKFLSQSAVLMVVTNIKYALFKSHLVAHNAHSKVEFREVLQRKGAGKS